jgi:hypothetical protein
MTPITLSVAGVFDPTSQFLTKGGGDQTAPTVAVPANKLLTIESVYSIVYMPSGQKPGLSIATKLGASSPNAFFALVLAYQTTYTERDGSVLDVYQGNNPMRVYFPTGPGPAVIELDGTRGQATTGRGNASVTIVGYLTDA